MTIERLWRIVATAGLTPRHGSCQRGQADADPHTALDDRKLRRQITNFQRF